MRQSLEQRLFARFKAHYDAHPAETAVEDVLVISMAAIGMRSRARFLKGWSRVQGPLARPEFAVVAVSTGALISPFAFLGVMPVRRAVVALYRNPQQDWVKVRGGAVEDGAGDG